MRPQRSTFGHAPVATVRPATALSRFIRLATLLRNDRNRNRRSAVDGARDDGYRGSVRKSSTFFVIGLAMLLLGAGNWAFGGPKMSEYKQRRRHAVQMGGPAVKLPFRGTLSILDKRTSANDLYDDADIK